MLCCLPSEIPGYRDDHQTQAAAGDDPESSSERGGKKADWSGTVPHDNSVCDPARGGRTLAAPCQ